MNPFRSYTYTWWQIGIFKLALLAIGAAAGAYWHEFFSANMAVILTIAILGSLYTMYVSFSQLGSSSQPVQGM